MTEGTTRDERCDAGRVRLRARLGLCFALALSMAAAPASAAPSKKKKKECASAYVAAQKLKSSGSLLEARKKLIVCASEGCLSAVRKDCTDWLDQVNAAIPTITVSAHDTSGQETLAVKVQVDGKPIADELTTNGIELDPGEHKLHFEMEGAPPIERKIILRAGEKNKPVAVDFGEHKAQPEATTDSAPAAAQDQIHDQGPEPEKKRSHVASYVLGGVGVVALGGMAYFWLSSKSAESDLDASKCAPNCNSADVDSIKHKRLFGDIALGVGVVSLGVATYLWIAPSKEKKRPPPLGAVDFHVLRGGGAYGSVSGRF